ncbi:hypothetical protein [Streptomyces atratus]|uniref:Uncharacterized protein n=1 Tax=Streptomyces atratus TaxID=1893 RepID=A0A2Z5JFS5_STRAR|nr:hypothetical protein [Streptomyces atratus]AXE79228.1 hypothetical protein C5746_22495 [Streptomyces atratus]
MNTIESLCVGGGPTPVTFKVHPLFSSVAQTNVSRSERLLTCRPAASGAATAPAKDSFGFAFRFSGSVQRPRAKEHPTADSSFASPARGWAVRVWARAPGSRSGLRSTANTMTNAAMRSPVPTAKARW